jgi:hypothetical protein
LCAIGFLIAPPVRADDANGTENSWDSRWSFDMAYPPSAALHYWVGIYEKFNLAQLHRINRELKPFEHGYIRPHIRLMSSIKVNGIEPRFDLYPFSFMGLTGGWIFSHRSLSGIDKFSKFTRYDCTQINCDGWNLLPFLEAKFKWGYGSVFGLFFLRRDWAWTQNPGTAVLSYDATSGMAFRSSSDELDQFWVMVGTRVTDDSQIYARYRYLKWTGARTRRYDGTLMFTQKFSDEWSAGFEYTRAHRNDHYYYNIFALRLNWNLRKTPAAEDALE